MLPLSAGGALGIASAPFVAAVGATDSSGGASGTDWTGYLLQGGPFAIILILILMDKLAPTGERNRLREENEKYKADIQTLNNKLLEVLPPLTEAAHVMTRVGDLLEAMGNGNNDPPGSRGRGGR